ncbi:MAG: histidine phosphatase family protein [Clostridia bacterium]|nr:histidine phosphatase family protein [Clostridia bacterium]
MDLYIIRHGESQGNVGLDVEDPHLTDLGKKQAELLALRLRNVNFDAILSSPLTRAIQTATPLAELQQKEITVVHSLHEAGAYGDESLQTIQQRAADTVSYIREKYGDKKNVIAFAHGTFNNHFIKAACGITSGEDFNFCQENTGVTIVRFVMDNGQPRTKLELANCGKHLEALK